MLMATMSPGYEPFNPRVGDLVDLVIGDGQPIGMRMAGLELLNRTDRSGDDLALGLVSPAGRFDDLIKIDEAITSRPGQRIAVDWEATPAK
jgi:hypothetical protein